MRENQRVVFQIALSVLSNGADAEEIAQEAFLRAYRSLPKLRAPEKFRAWICQISRRLALNRLRDDSRARQRESLAALQREAPIDIEATATDKVFERRVRAEIERMPEKLRSVMLLCAIEGIAQAAVAQLLDVPEGTVRSRLYLARRHLLKALDP